MKKILVCLMVLALFVPLFGCGGGEKQPPAEESLQSKLEAFVSERTGELDSVNKQFEGSAVFSMTAEEPNLVVNVKYLNLEELDADSLADSVNNSGDTYTNIYNAMKTAVQDDSAKLVVRFFNSKDEKVYEQTIDDSFTPGEDTADETLEDYIYSEDFQTSIASGSTDEIKAKAIVENGNVAVIVYELQYEVDSSQLDALRANWEETFSEADMAEEFINMQKALTQLFPNEEPQLLLRITDITGATLFEKDYKD